VFGVLCLDSEVFIVWERKYGLIGLCVFGCLEVEL
jgi:hypothetical protein